jgi:hypothetical protein
MLRQMPAGLLFEWREYEELEPFGEERADLRAAQIVQAIYNVNRDVKKYPNGVPLADCLLYFGDAQPPPRPQQTLEYQEMLIDAWCSNQNAIMAAKGGLKQ